MSKTKRQTAEQMEIQVEKIKARVAELKKSRAAIDAQIAAQQAELEAKTNAWKARLWDDYQAGLEKGVDAFSGERVDDESDRAGAESEAL